MFFKIVEPVRVEMTRDLHRDFFLYSSNSL